MTWATGANKIGGNVREPLQEEVNFLKILRTPSSYNQVPSRLSIGAGGNVTAAYGSSEAHSRSPKLPSFLPRNITRIVIVHLGTPLDSDEVLRTVNAPKCEPSTEQVCVSISTYSA